MHRSISCICISIIAHSHCLNFACLLRVRQWRRPQPSHLIIYAVDVLSNFWEAGGCKPPGPMLHGPQASRATLCMGCITLCYVTGHIPHPPAALCWCSKEWGPEMEAGEGRGSLETAVAAAGEWYGEQYLDQELRVSLSGAACSLWAATWIVLFYSIQWSNLMK